MNGTQLAALIRYKTTTNTATFATSDMSPLVDTFIDEIASMIVERNANYFLIPSTFDLKDDQRVYGFGDDLLSRIHKLEIKFASGDSRFPAKGIKSYGGSETESEIIKNFTNVRGGFAYVVRRRAVFILSGTIVDVTAGGRLLSHIYPAAPSLTGSADLATDPSTTSFGFPRQFHELLARRVSIEWKGARPTPVPLSRKELEYDKDLKVQLDAISSVDNSGEIIGELPLSQDLYNDGFDI